jgi:hypothetical protein
MLKLSKANGKLVKFAGVKLKGFPWEGLKASHVVSFGIPAFADKLGKRVCHGAGACAALCYARQGTYRFPASIKTREGNLSHARKALAHDPTGFSLASDLAQAIYRQAPRARIVRVHDSGDFFSQAYLDAWNLVCTRFPDKLFYAYTKAFDLSFSEKPRNFSIVQSEGSRWDHKIDFSRAHARIFPDAASRKAAGYIDGDSSDLPAILGKLRIGFVYHGGRNLTLAQVNTLKKGT